MRPTVHLLQRRLPIHITLFTRSSCALCTTARSTLSKVWDSRPFEYVEIDVMEDGNSIWKDFYEFDVPVIHVARTVGQGQGVGKEIRKLMHRFEEEEVRGIMEEVERIKEEGREEEG